MSGLPEGCGWPCGYDCNFACFETAPAYNKAYCLTRADYHANEAERCKRDLEVALAEYPQKPHLVDLFTHRHKEHTRYAQAWREAVEDAPE